MAFLTSDIVINDYASLVHESFGVVSTDVEFTETKIMPSDGVESDLFGFSVAVGSGRIVVGARGDDDNGFQSGSAYIFDLDGNQLTKITADDGAASADFGWSVAVGSGRIVVGAQADDGNGSAYIFDLDGNQLTKITADDGAVNDEFGYSVAVGSGRIVVGASGDDDNGSDSGSAYIFDLDGNQLTKITADDGTADDEFGRSVSVGSGRIVVGAIGHDGSGSYSGYAYVFDLDGNQLTKITPNDGTTDDFFGISVAVGSGRIVVGAPEDEDNGVSPGSAYVFDLDGNQLTKITADDGASGDYFGWSVAVGSGRIVVGASRDDDNGSNSGSAYIFDLDGNQLTKITADDGAARDEFGFSVAVGSGRIVVGANRDDVTSFFSTLSYLGLSYIYKLNETYDTYIEKILGK